MPPRCTTRWRNGNKGGRASRRAFPGRGSSVGWILPAKPGLKPRYEQHKLDLEKKFGQLSLIVSKDGRQNTARIYQDADLYVALLASGDEVTYTLKADRYAWLQVVRGKVTLNGKALKAGDGAAAGDEETLKIKATEAAELLLFDLA